MDVILKKGSSILGTLYLEITDSGIGLSEKQIENIFAEQPESTAGTTGEEGFGFGLSLALPLIKKQNGELEVTSEQGKGTRFAVTIPV